MAGVGRRREFAVDRGLRLPGQQWGYLARWPGERETSAAMSQLRVVPCLQGGEHNAEEKCEFSLPERPGHLDCTWFPG